MAVTSVWAHSVSGGRTKTGRRNYTVVFRVKTDSKLDDPIKVFSGSKIPSYADAYTFGTSQDAGVTMQTMECDYWDRESTAMMFRVTATYSNEPVRGTHGGAVDVSQTSNNPTLRPPKFSGSFVSEIVPFTHDAVDPSVAIVNPNGEPFRDAVKTVSHQSLFIELTKFAYDPYAVQVPAVNSAVFFGRPILTWKLDNIDWEQVYYGAQKYYEVRYSFLYNPDKWTYKPRIEGTKYKDASDNLIAFKSDDGFVLGDGYDDLNADGTKRDKFDGDGKPVPPLFYGVAPSGLAAGKKYPQIDFGSVLSIPTSL